jgi:hypothetical protein
MPSIGNGKLVATNDRVPDVPIHVFHWWPGRQWRSTSPIPSFLIREAERRGSRYLTLAIAETPEGALVGTAFCCPKDCPSRALGRKIALGRLLADMRGIG